MASISRDRDVRCQTAEEIPGEERALHRPHAIGPSPLLLIGDDADQRHPAAHLPQHRRIVAEDLDALPLERGHGIALQVRVANHDGRQRGLAWTLR